MIWLRLLPYALSGMAVAAVWWLWTDRAALQAEKAALSRELAVQEQLTAIAQETAAINKAHIERLEDQNATLEDLRRRAREREGGDAVLSDFLSTGARELWPDAD